MLIIHGITDVGEIREKNEDSYHIDEEMNLAIVADGMGGHLGGARASSLTCEKVYDFLEKRKEQMIQYTNSEQPLAGNIMLLMAESLRYASRKVYSESISNAEYRGMGTTCIYLWHHNETAYIAHVGDSRAYMLRDNTLLQLSEDHSLVNQQLQAGTITPEEAKVSRHKNVITRSIGIEPDIPVDVIVTKSKVGDIFLLCSDGLNGHLEDNDIYDFLEPLSEEITDVFSNPKLSELDKDNEIRDLFEQRLEEMIDETNQRGGEDNTTIALCLVRDTEVKTISESVQNFDDDTHRIDNDETSDYLIENITDKEVTKNNEETIEIFDDFGKIE